MGIRQILENFHESKSVDPEQLQKLRTELTTRQLNLRLWTLKSQIRLLMKLGKFQTNLLAFAGLFAFPYLMYEKYLSNPEKSAGIAAITFTGSVLLVAPRIYYKKFSAKIIEEISYNVLENKMILKPLIKQKPPTIPVSLQGIQVNWNKTNRPKYLKITENSKLIHEYYMEGIGDWESLEVFQHLDTNKNL